MKRETGNFAALLRNRSRARLVQPLLGAGCRSGPFRTHSFSMTGRIRTHLIRYARQQTGTLSYLTLVQEAELGFNLEISHEKSRLNEMLAEISTTEHEAGRPLLSGLIKVAGSKGQGDNFYKLCERLGMGEWRTLKQDEKFVKNIAQQCHDFWREEGNFQQFAGDAE